MAVSVAVTLLARPESMAASTAATVAAESDTKQGAPSARN
jgi:hypothetical protein